MKRRNFFKSIGIVLLPMPAINYKKLERYGYSVTTSCKKNGSFLSRQQEKDVENIMSENVKAIMKHWKKDKIYDFKEFLSYTEGYLIFFKNGETTTGYKRNIFYSWRM